MPHRSFWVFSIWEELLHHILKTVKHTTKIIHIPTVSCISNKAILQCFLSGFNKRKQMTSEIMQHTSLNQMHFLTDWHLTDDKYSSFSIWQKEIFHSIILISLFVSSLSNGHYYYYYYYKRKDYSDTITPKTLQGHFTVIKMWCRCTEILRKNVRTVGKYPNKLKILKERTCSISATNGVILHDMINDLPWKTGKQAVSLI